MIFDPSDNPDEIQLILLRPACQIPDRSTVMKKTGAVEYILRRNLVVYQDNGSKPFEIEGCFLVNAQGSINQINPDTILQMTISAADLYEELSAIMDRDPDDDK